jgi:outer membrane protein TolC
LAAEEQFAAARQAESDVAKVAAAVDAFVKVGEARKADSDRARARASLFRNEVYRAEEQVAVAAARLAQVLDLDPATCLQTASGPLRPAQLVDPSYNLECLISVALSCRPEMKARSAAIEVDETRLREEKVRPLLPTILAAFSAGDFGGGSDLVPYRFDQFAPRTDLDVWAVWTLQNAGIGNLAIQRTRRAEIEQAVSRRMQTINQIREEVSTAYAAVGVGQRQLAVVGGQLATAASGFHEELRRTRGGEGLPIEVLNSTELLARARRDSIAAVAGYDEAQFRLFVALGEPPTVALPNAGSLGAGADGPGPADR